MGLARSGEGEYRFMVSVWWHVLFRHLMLVPRMTTLIVAVCADSCR
jgi:hypothetical protein